MKSILGGIPLMKKQDLIDYIKNTPENLNMAILLQICLKRSLNYVILFFGVKTAGEYVL